MSEKVKTVVEEPIPMLLWCPMCRFRHIDPPGMDAHHTHACQQCGLIWKPALVRTVGVQYLPGCKNQLPITIVGNITEGVVR